MYVSIGIIRKLLITVRKIKSGRGLLVDRIRDNGKREKRSRSDGMTGYPGPFSRRLARRRENRTATGLTDRGDV